MILFQRKYYVSVVCSIFASFVGNNALLAQTNPVTQALYKLACLTSGGGSPLTKSDVEARGRQMGFKVSDSNVMGRAFQNFVFDSIGDVENKLSFPSPIREAKTLKNKPQDRYKSVVPDGSGPVVVIIRDAKGKPIGTHYYPFSAFEEVKLSQKRITLSSFDYQPTGFIDVLSRSPASKIVISGLRPTPRLTFHTTTDSEIAPSLLKKATASRVAIWQQVVCDNPLTPNNSLDMVMSLPIKLNAAVYTGSSNASPTGVPPAKPAVLR
jgi:hypothetical protein